MTSNYDDFDEYGLTASNAEDSEVDCFELLSAYIDGEASVAERKQVQQWLDHDPEIKNTYLQLLKLQGGMQNLTVPTQQTIPPEILSEQLFNRIDRNRNQKRAILWGSAIAATILGTIVNLAPSQSPSFRMAENSSNNRISEPIMVAVSLNKPAVVIPKAAVSGIGTQNKI